MPVLLAFLLAVLQPVAASAASIGIAWDPEPFAEGYRVYVGTTAGRPTESFEVGAFQTTFFYTAAKEGKKYYFSVATLGPGGMSGRSEEVSTVAGSSGPFAPAPPPASAPPPSFPTFPADPSEWWLGYSSARARDTSAPARLVATGLGRVESLVPLSTGDALFIESGQRVRLVSGDVLQSDPALTAPGGGRFLAVAADPFFAANGLVYTAEARPLHPGVEEVTVRRHRLLGGGLGESAAVAGGFAIPAGSGALLALSSERRVFFALTAGVFGVNDDGTDLRAIAGSAEAMAALAAPGAMLVDTAGALWLAGADAMSSAVVYAGRPDESLRRVDLPPVSLGPRVALTLRPGHAPLLTSVASGARVDVDVVGMLKTSTQVPVTRGTPTALYPITFAEEYLVIQADAAGASFVLLKVETRADH